MRWQEARRLAEAAQYGADPETYREPAPGVASVVVSVIETPTRYVVTFQPAPMDTLWPIPRQIIPVIPHSGQFQVDRATGEVRGFHALPEVPGTEDFWDGCWCTRTRSWAVRRSDRATPAERLPDGRLLVPMTAKGPGGNVGDGLVTIAPDHPDFQTWNDYLEVLGSGPDEQFPFAPEVSG